MATRDDVARLAGVSPSTVSYVISGRRTISDATKTRVLAAMRDLNYTPNALLRGWRVHVAASLHCIFQPVLTAIHPLSSSMSLRPWSGLVPWAITCCSGPTR